ncbi:hypothetical protein TPB0596_12400 [Tsukamurella pulmonis]|uniref:hypothetical protein n=1 Tax=Tsukamurella pulmonis TaxID=47312 RepID=UPI001EDD906B|nr:hypothetical protein [Tsukamurella pulmonis]BDD81477.1 hypothetical protein TPB0596_12400 [Tsukamurella pulmonis]
MGSYEGRLYVGGVTESQVAAVVAVLEADPHFDDDAAWATSEVHQSVKGLEEYPVKVYAYGAEHLVHEYLERVRTLLREAQPAVRFLADDDLDTYTPPSAARLAS